MSYDFTQWKISDLKGQLPYSDRMDIGALAGVFRNTSAFGIEKLYKVVKAVGRDIKNYFEWRY